MDSEDRHQRLVSWMIDNSIDLSRSLRLQESPLGGIGVFANKKIDKNSVLLSVPKDCVLSPATCGISNLLEEYEIDGMIGLTIAYMFEKSQGESSPWYAFLESFDYEPSPMSLPRFWTEQEQEWLKGTELEAIGGLDEEEVSSVYEEIVSPFIEENKEFFNQEFRSYEAYSKSLMAVCSRAFEVDMYRGLSLVPGACLFNHSMDEDVHFESHNEVCISCGAFDFCDHDVERIMEEAQGVYDDDDRPEPIETPREFVPELLDEDDEFEDVNGEQEEDEDEEDNSDDGDDYDDGDSDGEEEGPDSCDIRAIKTIAPGKEIFNTYGEYPNGILLSKYGFAEWDNLHETISLADQITAYAKSNSDINKRMKWWAKNFFLCIFPLEQIEEEGLDSEMPWQDTAEVLSNGQPSEGLKLLLNLLSLSPKKLLLFQARASKGNRDGLTQMSSPKEATQLYRKLVRKRLDRYKDSLTSAQYKALLDEIPPNECRKIMAIITRGTEKLVLERALEYKL